jgi:hypothetical protein
VARQPQGARSGGRGSTGGLRSGGLLLLDATVSIASLKLARDDDGRLKLQRAYDFEYSDTGDNRKRGSLVLLGTSVVLLNVGLRLVSEREDASLNQFALLAERRFAPFFLVQFLGAFNSNVVKNALVIFVTYQGAYFAAASPWLGGMESGVIVNLPRVSSSCPSYCSRPPPGRSPTSTRSHT